MRDYRPVFNASDENGPWAAKFAELGQTAEFMYFLVG
jgi:hypothetical protein